MPGYRGTITVFCSSRILEGDARYEEARLAGRLLAEAGFIVCSGGYQGLMEAVSRGAKEAGGHTIGVTLASFDPRPPNRWIIEEVKMPSFVTRVEHMVGLADGYLVLPGGMGTLAEMSVTWSLLQINAIPRRPCVLLGDAWARLLEAFRRELVVLERDYALLQPAATPSEAVARLAQACVPGGGRV